MTSATTLTELLHDVTLAHAASPAVIERANGTSRTTTYEQLRDDSLRAAAELSAHGVTRGDVVGVWLPNWTEALVLEFALASIGAACLGINTRYGVHELAHLLQTGGLVGLVLPEAFHGLDFEGRLAQSTTAAASAAPGYTPPWVCTVPSGWRDPSAASVSDGPDIGGGWWELGATEPQAVATSAGAGDPVNYFTTSGSTGAPKLAGHDQHAVATHARNVAQATGMRSGDVLLSALPLSGVFGFNPTMAMLAVGGTCLLEPVFEPASVLADMQEFAVTHAFGGDDLFGRLKDTWQQTQLPLPHFRRGGIADFAGRAREIIDWAADAFDAEISGVYGSSELFSLTAIWPSGRPVTEREVGGGRVVSPDIDVRAADTDGNVLRPGETGELQFRGYNVLTTYLGHPPNSALTADGWFRSGDLGRVTEAAGEFVYTCRAGDALRLRGFLVEPAEIERFLMDHPAVTLAKVVGVTDATGQDRAVAYVSTHPHSPETSEELLAYCRSQLAPFKVPSLLRVIAEFPVTTGTNGTKIRTAELREWAERDLAATVDVKGAR
jgi:fatty-acyl-CoA synthase